MQNTPTSMVCRARVSGALPAVRRRRSSLVHDPGVGRVRLHRPSGGLSVRLVEVLLRAEQRLAVGGDDRAVVPLGVATARLEDVELHGSTPYGSPPPCGGRARVPDGTPSPPDRVITCTVFTHAVGSPRGSPIAMKPRKVEHRFDRYLDSRYPRGSAGSSSRRVQRTHLARVRGGTLRHRKPGYSNVSSRGTQKDHAGERGRVRHRVGTRPFLSDRSGRNRAAAYDRHRYGLTCCALDAAACPLGSGRHGCRGWLENWRTPEDQVEEADSAK